jgi:hypothetical protein
MSQTYSAHDMDNITSIKIVKSILFSLGYGMAVVLLYSLFSYLFWEIRDHQAYFWVFYINKLFYSFQLPTVLLFALIFYNKLLDKLTMDYSVYEKISGYLAIGLLIVMSVLGATSESGEIFYLHGNY